MFAFEILDDIPVICGVADFRDAAVMTCVVMSGNGQKANVVTGERGSALFVEVPSSKPKDQAGMRTEVHNPAISGQSSFLCGLGLTVAQQLAFAVWLISPANKRFRVKFHQYPDRPTNRPSHNQL